MSTATVRARAASRLPEAQRPTLRLVATRPLVAGRLPFAVLVGAILALGLVALLLLHTLAAQDAFRLARMQQAAHGLSDTEQQLRLAEQQRSAPALLAARARALGMVPTDSIGFVQLHRHGKLVGVVKAAAPPPAPPPAPSPSASAPAPRRAGTASPAPATSAGPPTHRPVQHPHELHRR